MESTPHDPSPAILVLGNSVCGNDKILRALLGDSGTQTIFFDTKYYTAKAIIIAKEDVDPENDPQLAWEAVVLVFDTTRETSFNHVRDWASSHDLHFAEIRACVGLCADSKNDRMSAKQDWLRAAAAWCSSHHFEYLEIAPDNPQVDQQLSDGEAQGLPRLKEILTAHMWPGLILKDQSKIGPGGSILSPALASIAPNSTERTASIPADSALLDKLPNQDESISDSQLQEEMDNFEALIDGMAGARRQIGSLPDMERRQQAEVLTLQLLSKLKFDGGTDSDSDSLA